MCGIAGYLGPTAGSSVGHISNMIDVIKKRGPDYQRVDHVNELCVLGSARLRITDFENIAADMPFYSSDGRFCITYNGEIYNYKALRHELGIEFNFRTNSDTEVLLAAYQKWGKECLNKIKGMFSFCIYDTHSNNAFFAVDPTGQKPLYYLQYGEGLYFASDIEALVRIPNIPKSWDYSGIAQAIGIMFIFDNRTHIEQIKKMESGCFGIWSKHSPVLKICRYFKLDIHSDERLSEGNLFHIKEEIYETAKKCCFSTFDLEVPYAHLLSGGIDSSSIVAFVKQAGLDLSTYSIGLKAPGNRRDVSYNEFEYSQFVSRHFGTDHKQIELTAQTYCENLEKWAQICSEPHGAPEAASLYKLFEYIYQDGFRVAFNGSGPDEIFDGYGHGHVLKDVAHDDFAVTYFHKFNGAGSINFQTIMPDLDPERAFCDAVQPYLDLYQTRTDSAQLACALNFHTIYPVCELKQIDQTSMAHSIEVRSPYVELDLVNLAFRTPSYLKHHRGCEKWIFKESLRKAVPENIYQRKKAGFPISQAIYQTEEFKSLIRPVLENDSALSQTGTINMEELKKMFNSPNPGDHLIFYRLYILEHILQRHSQFM